MKVNGDNLDTYAGKHLELDKWRKLVESSYSQRDGNDGGVQSAHQVDNGYCSESAEESPSWGELLDWDCRYCHDNALSVDLNRPFHLSQRSCL